MIKRTIHIILFCLFTKIVIANNADKQPNIILILVDDLGWNDLQCYGSSFYETPNLDKLAKNGIKFTNAYASSPVCSPTRASVLTGKYPIKTDITDWIPGRQANGKATQYEKMIALPFNQALLPYEKTIAEEALQANYKTFFVGKWHLGENESNWPETHGFQINKAGFSKGSPNGYKNDSTGGFFTPYNNPRLSDGPKGEYLTDRLTDETLLFLQENEKPFFIMYSMYAVHNPMQAPKNLVQKYDQKRKDLNIKDSIRFSKKEGWMKHEANWKQRNVQDNAVYAAMIENMDTNIGRLVQKLEELNKLNNTIIIFTSDNGGLSTAEGSPTVNGNLRAGKGWLYEGGIRVPFIMHWPNKIKTQQVSNVPISSVDIYPTLYKAIFNKSIKNKLLDGEDILQIVKKEKSNRTLFWHYPHYSNQGGKPSAAMLHNEIKCILNFEDNSFEVYDLSKDVKEKVNIANNDVAKANLLKARLQQWLKKQNAKLPIANSKYNSLINNNQAKNVKEKYHDEQ
jgi:arylsulfatase A-like enzyme